MRLDIKFHKTRLLQNYLKMSHNSDWWIKSNVCDRAIFVSLCDPTRGSPPLAAGESFSLTSSHSCQRHVPPTRPKWSRCKWYHAVTFMYESLWGIASITTCTNITLLLEACDDEFGCQTFNSRLIRLNQSYDVYVWIVIPAATLSMMHI